MAVWPQIHFNKTLFGEVTWITFRRKTKLSIGTLRKAKKKTKPRSPDLIGELQLQRHTFEAIAKTFQMTALDEVTCNIAAWSYSDERGRRLNVQLSPPYNRKQTPRPDILETIFEDVEKE